MDNKPLLDSYKNNCNSATEQKKFCGSWTVRGKPNNKENIILYSRLNCKSWGCERCGPKRVRQLRHKITESATLNNLKRHMTLTLDPRKCSAEQSVIYIKKSWAKFRIYLKRKFSSSITYIAITEFQKNGYAHLHVLVDRRIPFAWIQQSWQAVGGGKFVNIQMVGINNVSAYLSKYLTSDILLSPNYGKYRRYSTSRDLKLFPKPKNGSWELIKLPISLIIEQYPRGKINEIRLDNGIIEWFNLSNC